MGACRCQDQQELAALSLAYLQPRFECGDLAFSPVVHGQISRHSQVRRQEKRIAKLKPDGFVAGAGIGCEFRECLGKLESVAREVVCGTVDALLEDTAGIERPFDGFSVTAEGTFALHLEVGGKSAETVHLIAHFAGSGVSGAAKAGIHGFHVFEKRLKFGVERIACGRELLLAFNWHGAGGEELGEGIGVLAEDAIDAEVVFVEELADGGFDESGGEAGFGGGDAAENALIENCGLGEVGDFRRAADDQGCAEKVVLEDGAEQGCGGDALRLGGENAEEVGVGEALATGLPELARLFGTRGNALEGEARAGAFVEEEEEA